MSWLRIDDGFAANAKIAMLSDREFRVWIRVLCYCAKSQDPTVDQVTIQEIPGFTRAVRAKLIGLELLDETGDDYEVHDWVLYQPKDSTGAERQARWRGRRNASRNGSRNASSNGSERYADRYDAVTESQPSRAGAHARPVPSRPEDKETRAVPPTRDAAHAPLPESPTSSNGKALGFHQQQIDQSLAEAKRDG